MITRKIFGSKARFCCEACADGFKCDREHCLIYPPYLIGSKIVNGERVGGKIMGVEEASIEADFCAYCGASE